MVDVFDYAPANFVRVSSSAPKNGTWTTYAEFGAANEFRGGLASTGLARGDKSRLIASNCVEWSRSSTRASALASVLVPMYEATRYGLGVHRARQRSQSARRRDEGDSREDEKILRHDPTLKHIVCLEDGAEGINVSRTRRSKGRIF